MSSAQKQSCRKKISDLSIESIMRHLKRRGEDIFGTKEVLVARLISALKREKEQQASRSNEATPTEAKQAGVPTESVPITDTGVPAAAYSGYAYPSADTMIMPVCSSTPDESFHGASQYYPQHPVGSLADPRYLTNKDFFGASSFGLESQEEGEIVNGDQMQTEQSYTPPWKEAIGGTGETFSWSESKDRESSCKPRSRCSRQENKSSRHHHHRRRSRDRRSSESSQSDRHRRDRVEKDNVRVIDSKDRRHLERLKKLENENRQLKIERERLAREQQDLLKRELERQRAEIERLEKEKDELRRQKMHIERENNFKQGYGRVGNEGGWKNCSQRKVGNQRQEPQRNQQRRDNPRSPQQIQRRSGLNSPRDRNAGRRGGNDWGRNQGQGRNNNWNGQSDLRQVERKRPDCRRNLWNHQREDKIHFGQRGNFGRAGNGGDSQ